MRDQPRRPTPARVLVVVKLEVPVAVRALTSQGDRRPGQIGADLHAERDALAGDRLCVLALQPRRGRDDAAARHRVPDAATLAVPRIVAGQVLPHPQHRVARGPLRVGGVHQRPLRLVVRVRVGVGRELDVDQVVRLAVQRLRALLRERLGGILGSRGSAQEEQQRPVRVPRLVRGRHHVLERLRAQDLRLVEHLDVDVREAATEALLTGAEHDDRPVAESDLLLTVRGPHAVVAAGHQVGPDLLALDHALHRAEGIGRRARAVSRPQHLEARELDAQRDQQRADRERLADLPRNAPRDTADRRDVLAGLVLAEHQTSRALLPRVELHAHVDQTALDARPPRRHDPVGVDQMASGLR